MKKSLFVLLVYSTLLTLSELAYRAIFHIPQLNASQIGETFALIAALPPPIFSRNTASAAC